MRVGVEGGHVLNLFFLLLQLSLWVELVDEVKRKLDKNPDAEHVRVLWRMERSKRVHVWRRLGRFLEPEELHLGGEYLCECPLDVEELLLLLPEGAGALAGLRVLILWRCASQVNNDFLRALASAGCGENLTWLSLSCGCFCA